MPTSKGKEREKGIGGGEGKGKGRKRAGVGRHYYKEMFGLHNHGERGSVSL